MRAIGCTCLPVVVGATISFAAALSGCSFLRPTVEGNQVLIARHDGKYADAARELRAVDLLTELDPQNLGCSMEKPKDEMSRLACALKGFYSYGYYATLPSEDRE